MKRNLKLNKIFLLLVAKIPRMLIILKDGTSTKNESNL